jgi:predicted nucleotidyltransferase
LSKEFEVYIESGRRVLEQLEDYIQVAKRVKRIVEGVRSDAEVYVFGSVLEGKYTAMSDIDILIVTDNISREDAYRLKAMIYRTIEAPLELHITSNHEFKHWYKRFIGKLERIT